MQRLVAAAEGGRQRRADIGKVVKRLARARVARGDGEVAELERALPQIVDVVHTHRQRLIRAIVASLDDSRDSLMTIALTPAPAPWRAG